jgi:alcohol dehydrogenase
MRQGIDSLMILRPRAAMLSEPRRPAPRPSEDAMADARRFPAFLVHRTESGACRGEVRTDLSLDQLPEGDLLVRVDWSSLNYKDALSATGHPGVTRTYPHVPGIDAAGTVVSGGAPRFQPGDPVVVTGHRLGMDHWGGFARYIRVPADWAVPLPPGLSARDSMRLGTAGFTAALAVDAVLAGCRAPGAAPVLVTGATGGVAVIAIALLARLGLPVTAVSRKQGSLKARLVQLGAKEVLAPEELDPGPKPLARERWSGVVDTVGGPGLEGLLKSTAAGGVVATSGMVAGNQFSSSVYPFILRGVTLAGIDSAEQPMQRRLAIWERLAGSWKLDLEPICDEIGLDGIPGAVREMLAGTHVGRTVVHLN